LTDIEYLFVYCNTSGWKTSDLVDNIVSSVQSDDRRSNVMSYNPACREEHCE